MNSITRTIDVLAVVWLLTASAFLSLAPHRPWPTTRGA